MNKKFIAGGVLTLVLFGLTNRVVFSDPGTSKDPIVSKSYVDNRIDDLKKYVDNKYQGLKEDSKSGSSLGQSDKSKLEVVELKKGQFLIGQAGTEIILRSGRAAAIGSELGGISDITAGSDLDTNQEISKNHLLIIPRSDGRGVYSKTSTFFMVRGDFEIQ